MMSPAGRRKVRKRKAQAENSRVKLTVFAGIMVLAVFLGFLTARFVIGPIIGYNADESGIRLAEDGGEKNADAADESGDSPGDSEETKDVSALPSDGYALQFGAFSTEDAARELADSLKEKGIDTKIVEAGDIFKVISPVAGNRDEAITALENAREKEVTDVFIASFQ